MTTNVICKRRRLLATDSRWSVQLDENTIAFVDDTGFDKMADRHMATIICAGDGLLIEQWRNWFMTPILNMLIKPPLMRQDHNGVDHYITISLITKPDGRVPFSKGWYCSFEEEAYFSGSGAEPARDCYSINKCGLTAVTSAGRADPMTGGETKFVEIETFRTNLGQKPTSMQDVHKLFETRGMIMDIRTKKVEPINRNDPKAIAQALSAGTLSLSAPAGQSIRPWTRQETADLDAALADLARAEEAANR